jgi:hypothetical protein
MATNLPTSIPFLPGQMKTSGHQIFRNIRGTPLVVFLLIHFIKLHSPSMPRLARLDIAGLLQHVIVRGNERRDIFIIEGRSSHVKASNGKNRKITSSVLRSPPNLGRPLRAN